MRPDWQSIRFRLEYLAFRAAARLFRGLGLQRASAFSGAVWRVAAPWSKRHGRALGHLAHAFPEKTPAEREAICRDMWENLGRTFAEAFFLKQIAAEDRISIEGGEVLEAWARSERGRVMCGAHVGNWELGVLSITRQGLHPWCIYRPIKNPRVDAEVLKMREFLYTGGLVPKDPALPRQFLRILKQGGTVGILADLRAANGDAVPVFGRPAASTVFPALLAHSTGSPILVSCMRRLPGVRFIQTYEVFEPADTGDRRADIATTTANVQNAFERFIRQWPDQWMWAHRRWG